jgi:citrate synthase
VSADPIIAPRGLEGVIVADTSVGDVRGPEGFFHYRQYDGVALAETRSFEDVWHLLLAGELPDAATRTAFAASLAAAREVPPAVLDVLPRIAGAAGGVMDALRTAASFVGATEGMCPTLDLDPAARERDAVRMAAVLPTLVAALHRLRSGEQPVAPRSDLGHAANFLWMLHGEEPDPARARALERYWIITIDHGFNTSTFAARIITSTGADVAAAVVGAIGALSGPLHGGAPSRVLDLLDAIGRPELARAHLEAMVDRGERIMGFGHRYYRTDDPRSVFLRSVAREVGAPRSPLAEHVERTLAEVLAERKPGRPLFANVELYAGVVLDHCGLDRTLFAPTFACSRVVGWCANILEQAADNRVVRPAARYVGPPPPQPVPEA